MIKRIGIDAKDGDTVAIAGDYQFQALHHGPAPQRFWHHSKILAVGRYLPPGPNDSILDVGCGSGVVSHHLGESGARVLGIDINPQAIDFATRRFGGERIRFAQQLVDQPFPVVQPVDKIYCMEVIEHIHESQGRMMLEQFHAALRPRGKVLITTPNYHSPWPILEWLMDRSGRFPQLDGEQHVAHYHRRNLAALCESAGFRVVVMSTMNFIAPWLAPLSWPLAEKAFLWESRHRWLPGCNLVCVLERQELAAA